MIKTLTAFACTVVFCISSYAQLDPLKGQEGSGGGGIIKDGKFVTFYSAGIYTSKIPERLKNIPGAEKLLHEINNFPGLSVTQKGLWTKKIIASLNRRYFKVLEKQIDDKAIDQLISKYREALNIDQSSSLGVFAITDIKSKTTLLLPEFYNLTKYEQMAILFHEAYWLVFPESSYQQTINAEVTAQEYFETKDSLSGLEFLKAIDAYSDSLFYAVEVDIANNALGDLIVDKKILAKDLVGIGFLTCLRKYKLDTCKPYLADHSYEYSLTYPDSLLLYVLSELNIEFYHFHPNSDLADPNNTFEWAIRRTKIEFLSKASISLARTNKIGLSLTASSNSSDYPNLLKLSLK